MAKIDPFFSPKKRLSRANDHIKRLKKRTDSFFLKVPHQRVIEKDAEGLDAHLIRFKKKIPQSCIDSATEALEALRSVLDQTGYAAAVLGGAAVPKSSKFPAGDTPTDITNDIRRGCKDLPPSVASLFESFQPYKGGNNPLWVLNKLRNATHTVLNPMAIIAGGMKIHKMEITGTGKIPAPIWDAEKNEIVFARTGPGAKYNFNIEISLFVALGDPSIVNPAPAVELLKAMAGEVKRVLMATEAECRRLGFI
jgi:hypothetical protein